MESFYHKISGVMEDLIIGIVALGILVVSFEYVQFYIDFKNQIPLIDFLQRIVLFLAVVMFTAHYFVAYSAYFLNKHFDNTCEMYSARRMVVMYLLDLMAVTIASWLYAVLLIGTLTSTPDALPEVATKINLKITMNDMNTLFTIMALWHFIIALWYFVAFGRKNDKVLHLIYMSIYIVLVFATHFINTEFFVWMFILAYMLLVLSLYNYKGVPDIKNAIKTQRENGC